MDVTIVRVGARIGNGPVEISEYLVDELYDSRPPINDQSTWRVRTHSS